MPPRRSPSPAVHNAENVPVGRRVTRSQSREVEVGRADLQGSSGDDHAGAGAAGRPGSRRGLGKGSSSGEFSCLFLLVDL